MRIGADTAETSLTTWTHAFEGTKRGKDFAKINRSRSVSSKYSEMSKRIHLAEGVGNQREKVISST